MRDPLATIAPQGGATAHLPTPLLYRLRRELHGVYTRLAVLDTRIEPFLRSVFRAGEREG